MAEIQILSLTELHARDQQRAGPGRPRSAVRVHMIEAYKAVLRDVQPGYGGDVLLAAGEEKRLVRQQLHAVA